MTIYEQIKDLMKDKEGEVVSLTWVKNELKVRHGTNPKSIILSDYCYNRWNKGIAFEKHIFQYMSRNQYKYLGENVKYTGPVFTRPKGKKRDQLAGEWRAGKKSLNKDMG
jgi:hypothetical protein